MPGYQDAHKTHWPVRSESLARGAARGQRRRRGADLEKKQFLFTRPSKMNPTSTYHEVGLFQSGPKRETLANERRPPTLIRSRQDPAGKIDRLITKYWVLDEAQQSPISSTPPSHLACFFGFPRPPWFSSAAGTVYPPRPPCLTSLHMKRAAYCEPSKLRHSQEASSLPPPPPLPVEIKTWSLAVALPPGTSYSVCLGSRRIVETSGCRERKVPDGCGGIGDFKGSTPHLLVDNYSTSTFLKLEASLTTEKTKGYGVDMHK
ncbi:hypothetical protein B0J13DRAFT_524024 [Dactylonectria estremocensis]|uniref:Uncharacterized protein n=1 Tax=Dactylonectria estremocensis TaxID=1079267 RepID=A0A9P9EZG1_9HYPO|nr:hypothetical protein B0J13DRAFT_524024 [Dactylonectria estremocensis]